MRTHINIVALVHIVLGTIGLLGGLAVVAAIVVFGGVGALAAFTESAIGGLAVTGAALLALLVAGGVVLVTSLPGVLAGVGLLRGRRWAPAASLILSFFHLFNFPLGSLFAVYSGWVMVSEKGQKELGLAA